MNIQESAKEYHEHDGWNVAPIVSGGKTPAIKDLDRILLFPETSEDIKTLFPDNNRNIAAICGAVSAKYGALNVLDFENRFMGGYHRLYESNTTFRRIADNTRRTETQSGGKHVYVETDKPINSLSIDDDAGKRIIDLQAYKKYVLVPPSRIKSPYLWEHWNEKQGGKIYRASLEEINEILGLFGKEAHYTSEKKIADDIATYNLRAARLDSRGDLSKKLYRYLVSGSCTDPNLQTAEGCPDRSRLEFMIVTRFVRLGFSDKAIKATFTMLAYQGAKFRERPELLTHALGKARTEWQKSDLDKQIEEYIQHVIYMTDLSVYERVIMQSILEICRSIGRFENVQLAQRELALRTGAERKTISKHMKSLEARGLLHLDKRTDSVRATRFSVKLVFNSIRTPYLYCGGLDVKVWGANCNKSDSFHRFALGKTGKVIVEILNQNINMEFGIRELVELSGISYNTVKAKLELLQKHGLVDSTTVKDRGRPRKVYWIESPIANLLGIAIAKGTDGKGMLQERRIEGEQTAHRERLKGKAIEEAKRNGGEIEKRYEILFVENEKE